MKITSPGSPQEFEDYYNLRWEVLRKPWKQPKGSEKDELENSSFHFMAQDEHKQTVGVCRLQKNSATEGQIRFMAVSSSVQGKGIGAEILKKVEKKAVEENLTYIILQARDNAVEFYKKNGYSIVEKSFLMWGEIQHYLMKKEIRK